jgi:hypothetical protein
VTTDDPTLEPEPAVRRRLGARIASLRVIRPPFPAVGVGALRVLRVRDLGEGLALDAGYDNYERLD